MAPPVINQPRAGINNKAESFNEHRDDAKYRQICKSQTHKHNTKEAY